MILLASGEVGLRVTEYLASRQDPIDWLVLDAANGGGCNDAIERAFLRAPRHGRMATSDALASDALLAELRACGPDLGILAWWPRLVKSPLLEIPVRGWLNLHPAYLPFNRGKHPNFWCLVEETPCGAALHFIDRGVDTGPLVARAQLETSWEDTGESVHRRCRELAVDLFRRNFEKVASGSVQPQPQNPSDGTSHRAAQIEAASEIELDATYTARRLLNIVRARMFPPHPTAFFTDGGKRFSVEVQIREIPESAA